MNKIKPYSALQLAFDHHHYGIAKCLIEYSGDSKEELDDPSKLYSLNNLKAKKKVQQLSIFEEKE